MFQNIFTFILFTLAVQNACASQNREKRFIGALKSWIEEKLDPKENEPIVILPIPPSEHHHGPGQNFIHTPHRVPTVENGTSTTSSQSAQIDTYSLVESLRNMSPLALIGYLHRLASQNGFVPSPEFTRAALRLFSNKEGLELFASLINAGVVTPYRDRLADEEKDAEDAQASGVVEVKPVENVKETLFNTKASQYPFKLRVPAGHIKVIKPHHAAVGHSIHKHQKHRLPFVYKVKTRLVPTGLTPALHTIKHKPVPPKEVHVVHHVEKVTPKPTPPPPIPHVEYEVPDSPVVTPHLEYAVPEPPPVTPHLEYGVPTSTYGLPSSAALSIFNKNVTPILDKDPPTTPSQVPHAEYGVPPAPALTTTLNYPLPASTYNLPSYVPPSVFSIDKLLRSPVTQYTFNASPINNNFVPPVASYLSNYAFSYPQRHTNVVPLYNGVQTPTRFLPASYEVPYLPKLQYNLQSTSGQTPSQHLNSLNNLFSTSIASLPSEDANFIFRIKPLNTWDSVVNSPTPITQRISALPNYFAPPLVNPQSLPAQHIGETSHSSVNQFYNPSSYYHSLNQNHVTLPGTGNNILQSAPVLVNQNVPRTSNVSINTYTPPLPSLPHFHISDLEAVKPINVTANHILQNTPYVEATSGDNTNGATLLIPSSGESIVTVKEEVNQITGDPALITTYVQPGFSYKQISHHSPLSLEKTPPKIELAHYDPSFLIVVPTNDDDTNQSNENTNTSEEEITNVDNSIDVGSESAKIESIAEVEPEQELQADSNATAAIDVHVESNTLQPLTPVRLTGFDDQKYNPLLRGMRRRRRYRTTQRPITIETVPTTISPTTEKIIDLFTEDSKVNTNVENNNRKLESEALQTNSNKSESDQREVNVNDIKYRETTTIVDGRPLVLTTFQKPGYSFKIYSKTPDAEEIIDDEIHLDENSNTNQLGTGEPSGSVEPLLLKQDVNELLDKSETTHVSPIPSTPLIIPDTLTMESESVTPKKDSLKHPRVYSRRVVTNNIRTTRGRTKKEKEQVSIEVQ